MRWMYLQRIEEIVCMQVKRLDGRGDDFVAHSGFHFIL